MRPFSHDEDSIGGGKAVRQPISGDHVARPGDGAADRVVQTVFDEDAIFDVPQRGSARGIGADQIALDPVTSTRTPAAQIGDVNAISHVPRNEIAGARCGATDEIIGGVD